MGEGDGAPTTSAPYRTSARDPEPPRSPPRRRLRSPAVRLVRAPRFVGLGLVGVVALTFGGLNAKTWEQHEVLAPRLERVEDLAAIGLLATIPLVSFLLVRAWRLLPASRAVKRKHLARGTAVQSVAVLVGILVTIALRPSSARVVASSVGPHGQVGYAYRWDWGCGYRVGVSHGSYSVRAVAAVGPLPCDAPPPRIDWRGTELALVAADGSEIAAWPTEP
jgi:hypothetical protein